MRQPSLLVFRGRVPQKWRGILAFSAHIPVSGGPVSGGVARSEWQR
jgi:hypothetical protein